MHDRDMKRLMSLMSQLTFNQRSKLRDKLFRQSAQAEVAQVIEERLVGQPRCPHCQALHVVRNGQADGLQRYKCRGRGKTFNALSGTPMARLRHKSKWLAQAQVLNEGLSGHAAAKKLQVAPSTAFRWRHRFLAQAKAVKARVLIGIAETHETFILRSNKGQHHIKRKARRRGGKSATRATSDDHVPVLVAMDRSGACTDFMPGRADKAQLMAAPAPALAPDVVLCTDGSSAMAAAARQFGVEHRALNMSTGDQNSGAMARPERQRVSRPTQNLDGALQGRRDFVLGQLPGLVQGFGPVQPHLLAARVVARIGRRLIASSTGNTI